MENTHRMVIERLEVAVANVQRAIDMATKERGKGFDNGDVDNLIDLRNQLSAGTSAIEKTYQGRM